ncbi:hypothetical protein [Gordonia sp. FQ]|uniref:hypothetical protein n=1 Tax=Gordonia sp. FQ TaxID=3446634 RepID=UPI003F85E0BF
MAEDFPIDEGTTLTTAVFSVPVGGLVQVWTDKSTIWHLHDAEAFSAVVGLGGVARTRIAPGRYREACLFDEDSGTLMLQERHAAEHTADGYQVGGRVFTSEPPSEVAGSPWDDLRDAVARAAGEAFGRGELIVVEPGGWDDSDGRYCLIAAMSGEHGEQIVLETVPVPAGSTVWPATDDTEGQTVSAPITDDALRAAGTLAIDAVNRWGVAPWDVTITYIVPAETRTEPEGRHAQ